MPDQYVPQVGQIGSQLDTTFFLFDNCIQNMDNVPLAEYERMLETDETVSVGIQFLTLSILIKLGEYSHENPKITAFVRENFESMQGNLYTACEEILTGLWAGYSGSELVWKPSGSQIMLDKIVTYHPKTVLIQVDRETGDYTGLKQWRWFAGSPIDIPAEKSVLFTYNKKFGNHYGKSMFKPIRKNWLLKDPVLKMWGRALDRFGTPLIAAFLPDEEIDDPEKPGEKVSQISYATRLLSKIQSGTGLVFRSGSKNDGTESRADVLTTGGTGVGEAFLAAITYLNKMLLRGLLVPSLVFDDGSGKGSYALGQSHFETFDMTISSIFRSVTECLLEQVVRRMIEYNFGKQKSYGAFAERKLGEEDRKLLSECFLNLGNGGWITPQNQEDMDAVRDAMKLPERKVEPIEQQVKSKAQQEYNRYPIQDGQDIGDPLAGQDDAA
jgi:hypothetical protein